MRSIVANRPITELWGSDTENRIRHFRLE